jgi:hypothetical protein
MRFMFCIFLAGVGFLDAGWRLDGVQIKCAELSTVLSMGIRVRLQRVFPCVNESGGCKTLGFLLLVYRPARAIFARRGLLEGRKVRTY